MGLLQPLLDGLSKVSSNMREAPPEFEARRDNLAEKGEKPCLFHQFGPGDLHYVAQTLGRAGHLRLEHVEQDYGTRLVHLHIGSKLGFDHDECDARIIGPAISFSTLIVEPDLPVFLVELSDLVPVL